LQECVHQFRKLEEGIDIEPLIEQLAARPPLDVTISEETEQRLPELAGGLSLALARSFRIIDPDLKNPSSEHWDRTFRLFDLLL
jgi:hypothetical protein